MRLMTELARMWLTRSISGFQFTNRYEQHLSYDTLDHLGLYVHIPFCRSICDFCPYCKERYDRNKCDRYIDDLLREIAMVGAMQEGKKEVTSLYFGGGSPALAADRLPEIIAALRRYYVIRDGIGIELHPQDVTASVLQKLKTAGITKISIGVQSFSDRFANTLGRSAPDHASMQKALQAVPFETVSMDFIFALPGQTFDDLSRDVDLALTGGANHVALYPFIKFDFAGTGVKEMDRREKRRLLDRITAYCRKKRLTRTSIWTFSAPSATGYSSMTREHFLGFGCSATTLLKGTFKVNTFSTDAYHDRLAKGQLPTSLTIYFTRRQRMVYYLFWSLYGLCLKEHSFSELFGTPLMRMYGTELLLARMLGLLRKQDGAFYLTDRGAFWFHHYENYYTYSYIDKMWGLMRKQAFPAEMAL